VLLSEIDASFKTDFYHVYPFSAFLDEVRHYSGV